MNNASAEAVNAHRLCTLGSEMTLPFAGKRRRFSSGVALTDAWTNGKQVSDAHANVYTSVATAAVSLFSITEKLNWIQQFLKEK